MTDTSKIAFVGLGAMGHAMATTLVKHQFRVTGFDIREAARQKFETAGGSSATSAKAAAEGASTLILMTVNIDQAESVLFEAAALDATAKGANIVLMATCAPARVASLAKRIANTGRQLIDAPVSGGVVGAEAGTLSIMAAAEKSAFERAKPMLAAMGSGLVYMGSEPGQGAAMKIVNQLLCGIHIAVAAEGLAFAERQGIDPKQALEILSGSAASSWMLKNRGPRMLEADPDVTSAVDIFVKDMGLVLDAGSAAKMSLPLAALANQAFLAASGMGLGAKDDSQVIETYRALTRKK